MNIPATVPAKKSNLASMAFPAAAVPSAVAAMFESSESKGKRERETRAARRSVSVRAGRGESQDEGGERTIVERYKREVVTEGFNKRNEEKENVAQSLAVDFPFSSRRFKVRLSRG